MQYKDIAPKQDPTCTFDPSLILLVDHTLITATCFFPTIGTCMMNQWTTPKNLFQPNPVQSCPVKWLINSIWTCETRYPPRSSTVRPWKVTKNPIGHNRLNQPSFFPYDLEEVFHLLCQAGPDGWWPKARKWSWCSKPSWKTNQETLKTPLDASWDIWGSGGNMSISLSLAGDPGSGGCSGLESGWQNTLIIPSPSLYQSFFCIRDETTSETLDTVAQCRSLYISIYSGYSIWSHHVSGVFPLAMLLFTGGKIYCTKISKLLGKLSFPTFPRKPAIGPYFWDTPTIESFS